MTAPTPTNPRARQRRLRLWAFRLFCLLILPVLVLGLIEGSLRLIGYGFDPDFIVSVPGGIRGHPAIMGNPKFGHRFFPPQIARMPEPFACPSPKPPGTCRIFVVGSSAAQGFPDPSFAFCRFLEVILRERCPGTDFEVVNAAMVAINSHVVLPIVESCAEHEPDLFIVYEGNNEVIGPWGPGTVFAGFSPNLTAIRSGMRLRATRFGQLIHNTLAAPGKQEGVVEEWTGMEQFINSKVAADDPRLSRTYDHFRANLTDICAAAAPAPVLLCTVGVNLRGCAPFASLHRSDLTDPQLKQWQTAFDEGVRRDAQGDNADALAAYQSALAIDDRHAELRFRLARCLLAAGQPEESKPHFSAARDLDALRFRTDSKLNQVIRDVAATAGGRGRISLVDIERLFADPALSPVGGVGVGIPGNELLLEHCHMSIEGNYRIAAALSDEVLRRLPSTFRGATTGDGPVPTLAECLPKVGYTVRSRHKSAVDIATLMQRPPFTLQAGHEADAARITAEVAAAKAAMTPESFASDRQALSAALNQPTTRARDRAPTADWNLRRNYASLLSNAGDYRAAAEQLRELLKQLPFDTDASFGLGSVLVASGDLAGAEQAYENSLQSPYSNSRHRAEVLFSLGVVADKRSDSAAAKARYEEALKESPRHLKSIGNLGLVHMRLKDARSAEACFRRVIELDAKQSLGYLNLGIALTAQKRFAEAAETYQRLLALAPNDPTVLTLLGDLELNQQKPADALKFYERAASATPPPGSPDLNLRLGSVYLQLDRLDEAEARLTEVLKARPNDPQAQAAMTALRAKRGG